MTQKIGRNDPCPCRSGKKYKHCCLRKSQSLPEIPWETFPESFVIGELLAESERFAAFYESERSKIAQQVYWAQDPDLEEGIDYRTTRIYSTRNPKGIRVIRLRQVPAALRQAISIAHELLHFVLDAEGFPTAAYRDNRYETLASSLSSVISDPIINSRLLSYGFDVKEAVGRENARAQRSLAKLPEPPAAYLVRLRWVFNYAGRVLEWRSAYGDSAPSSSFETWFSARYPTIAGEAQDLLALIEDSGYATPAEHRRLLSEIIEKYRLQNILSLDGP